MFRSICLVSAGLQAVLGATPHQGVTSSSFPTYRFEKDVGSFGVKVKVVIKQEPFERDGEMFGIADFAIAVRTPVKDANGNRITVQRICKSEEYLYAVDGNNIELVFPSFDNTGSCTSAFVDEMNSVIPEIIEDGIIALRYNRADRSLNCEITAPVKIEYHGLE